MSQQTINYVVALFILLRPVKQWLTGLRSNILFWNPQKNIHSDVGCVLSCFLHWRTLKLKPLRHNIWALNSCLNVQALNWILFDRGWHFYVRFVQSFCLKISCNDLWTIFLAAAKLLRMDTWPSLRSRTQIG